MPGITEEGGEDASPSSVMKICRKGDRIHSDGIFVYPHDQLSGLNSNSWPKQPTNLECNENGVDKETSNGLKNGVEKEACNGKEEEEDVGLVFKCASAESEPTARASSASEKTSDHYEEGEAPMSRVQSGVRYYSDGDYSPQNKRKPKHRFQKNIVDRWRSVVEKALSMEDPWVLYEIEEKCPEEECIRHRYSSIRKKWVVDTVRVKMESESFARGAMRLCYRLKKLSNFHRNGDWSNAHNYVAKQYIDPETSRDTYFEDVRLQMDAKLWAEEYNRHNPPKKVDIFQITILEFKDRADSPLYHLEHFIEGDYHKYNSNSGFVSEVCRKTPHAFSHFTFERSGHQLIVVDVQGVGDLYTDPQIHTREGTGYGDGNLGTKGMALFFYSHICNEICRNMDLTPFDLSPTERATRNKVLPSRQSSATVCNKKRITSCLTPTSKDTEDIMEFLRHRTISGSSHTASLTEEDEDAGMDFYSEEPKKRSSGVRMGSDEVFVPHVRRNRQSSELDSCSTTSSGLTQLSEREAYWEAMRKMSRPAGMDNFDAEELRNLRKLSEESVKAGSILGQVHLDLCRYHELGRFLDTEVSTEYDRTAAWFHLELAANCGVLEAILTAARIFLGLPHDLLEEFTVEKDESNEDAGLDWMQTAAEMGDKGAILFLAEAFEMGAPLGSERERSYKEAVYWLERALGGHMDEDGEECESEATLCTVETPRYQIHAKLAELYRSGGFGLEKNPMKAGDYYNEAAEEAMESAKGKLATKYYQMAEEAWAEVEEE